MSCYVYVLRLDYKTFYTGLTNNIARRIKEHRNKHTGYTSNFNIKEIVFIYKLDNRKQARKVELYIKKQGALKYLLKNEKSLISDHRTIQYTKILIHTKLIKPHYVLENSTDLDKTNKRNISNWINN